MIRRSPCEFYLKYLIVHPSGHGNDAIHELCARQQLDSIDDNYLERLRLQCVAPVPFYPTDPLHTKSQRFLLKERIQLLFLSNPDMDRALKLLDNARAKEFVEAMTLSGAPIELLASALGPHRKFPCTPKTIEYYQHFFWNVDLIDTTELKALLQLRAPMAEHVPEGQKRSAAALNKAFRDDPRVVAANLPHSPTIALMSQMRMGLMPRNIDLAAILTAARAVAAVRAYEASLIGGPFDSKKALEFTMVAKAMGEMLETVVKPDERLRAELSTIALQTELGPVPSIHALSGGEHTVEVSPKVLTNEPRSGARDSRVPSTEDGDAQ